MTTSQRIFINTVAQYSRTVINMFLSLYTVRLVLSSLGQSDFGIYSLVAGVVAMLSFITNSLVNTTQRFISFNQGTGNKAKLIEVFNNSLCIHIFIGLILVLILELITPFLFSGFLNIPLERESAAIHVYQIVVIMLFTTFITAPYKALLISHENIVFTSFVEVLDAVLKVILVILMTLSDGDKLIIYSYIILIVQFFHFLILSIYCYIKYSECIFPNPLIVKMSGLKDMMSYASWSIYATLCLTGRNQGLSILLNRLFGTIINASWGIGIQLSGYTQVLSSAIVNAVSPQIVKSEGSGNRDRTIRLSNILSKLVFFLMSIIGIPCIFEIDDILNFWLKNPPEYASFFAILFIVALLIDSITIGMTHINNAIGKIGLYTVVMCTPKLFTFALVWGLMKFSQSLYIMGACYIAIETICALLRVPMVSRQTGLKVGLFFKEVVLKEILPVVISCIFCFIFTKYCEFSYRFILTFILSSIIYCFSFYCLGLTNYERNKVNELAITIYTKYSTKVK